MNALIQGQLKAVTADHPASREAVLGRLIRGLSKNLTDRANGLLREHGLALPEYNALVGLQMADSAVSVSDLAQFTGEKPANTTRIIDQIVRKGWVTRSPSDEDRRVWLMQLTPGGAALIATLTPSISTQLRELFSPLDDGETVQLEALLRRLLAQ